MGITCGVFEQLSGTGSGKFNHEKSKHSNARGRRDVEVTNNLIGALSLPFLSYFMFEVCSLCKMHLISQSLFGII